MHFKVQLNNENKSNLKKSSFLQEKPFTTHSNVFFCVEGLINEVILTFPSFLFVM